MYIFSILNINFKKISFITIIIMAFYEILNSKISSTHLKPLIGNLCDIAHPYKLFILQYLGSNFTLILFKADCHVTPGAVRKKAGSRSYISRHFESYQIHLLTMIYCFKHTNIKIMIFSQMFYFKIFTPFFCVFNLHQ